MINIFKIDVDMRKILFPFLFGNIIAFAEDRPNIIIILADDIGFSDIGCFGGEINTPILDSLAHNGLRMTQMYNSARSCPSRANLLTGLYPHQTGLGHMAGKGQKWPKGYAGFRSESDNVTIAEVLKDAGYYTAMSGKWHLGNNISPIDRGFQEFYGLIGGFNSMWNPNVYTRLPEDRDLKEYADGEFYATNVITDYAIDFINEAHAKDKPIFLYLSYNAAHFPLHAPKNVIDKYMDVYLKGWDVIRQERWNRIVDLNLLQGNPRLSPRGVVPEGAFVDTTHSIPSWNSLDNEHRLDLARRMSVYAAMIDIMDTNIGRVIETLKNNGELDNTFIMFASDNGACGEWNEFGFDKISGNKYKVHKGKELDAMGLKDSYIHYGTGWANACCTPFTLYKHYAHEGGISTPFIAYWGNRIKRKGSIDHQPAQFSDIMPTCCDLAGVKYPSIYRGRRILPTAGVSILPILKGEKIAERYIYAEHEGNRMVRKGDWKLVSANFKNDKWELYNITDDRTEQIDLSSKYVDKVKKMEKAYFKWADKSDVLYFQKLWNTLGNTKLVKYKENKLGR